MDFPFGNALDSEYIRIIKCLERLYKTVDKIIKKAYFPPYPDGMKLAVRVKKGGDNVFHTLHLPPQISNSISALRRDRVSLVARATRDTVNEICGAATFRCRGEYYG